MTFDMNDAEPQKIGELIPDGSFAKVTMIIRPGGVDGQAEIDQGLLKAPKDPTSDVRMLDCEFTVLGGPARPAQVLADVHGAGRQGRRERRLDRLEDLQEHLPRDDRQRARPRPAGHERGGEAEARAARPGRSQRHHLRRQGQGRAERGCSLRRQNRLDRVVLPTEQEWKLVMDGKDVPASPSRSRGQPVKPRARSPPGLECWPGRATRGVAARPPQTSGAPAWSPASSVLQRPRRSRPGLPGSTGEP